MDPFTGYLFTQGVLGVAVAALIIVVVYQQKKMDKKDVDYTAEIKALNTALLLEIRNHANDYKEMAKDNQEVLQSNSQNMALFGEKIEVAKGRR